MGRTSPQSRQCRLSGHVLLFTPVWLLNGAGFMVTCYSQLSYFAIFRIGYCLLSQEPVLAQLEKYWAVLLAAWIA